MSNPLPGQRAFCAPSTITYPGPGRAAVRFDTLEALAAFYACPAHPMAAPCIGETCPMFKAYASHGQDGKSIRAIVCKCALPPLADMQLERTADPLEPLEWSDAAEMGYVAPKGQQHGPQATKGASHA